MGCTLRLAACALCVASAMAAAAFAAEERLSPGFVGNPLTQLAEAERLMSTEPKRALDIAAALLDHPEASFTSASLARLHYIRARASTHAGQHRDAIAEGELALELLDGADPNLRADILTTMSISLGRIRETRRAFELQQEALGLKRELKDAAGEATSLSALAELYLDIGLTDKGVATFEEAVAQARMVSDPRVLAITLNNFAYFLQLQQGYDRADKLLREAMTLKVDNPRLEAYIAINAADAAYFLGRPDESEALIRKSIPVIEALQPTVLLVGANLGLARLARDRGDLENARILAERALSYARGLDNHRELSDITRLLADINEELGDHAAAYSYLRGHAAHLAADAASASARSAALFDAETQLADREQEVELLRRDSRIAKLAAARAEILRNTAILGALLLAAGLAALALLLREKARAKAHIEAKNRELTNAYDLLETANRNKSNFLAVMSHELKTPLNSIIGFSDLLAKTGGPNASAGEFARIINVQGRNLLRMVSEILLFTSSTDQEIALDEGVETIPDLLLHSIATAEEIRPGARARIDLTGATPDVLVSCDLSQLANCIARLLDNALKFSPDGSRVALSARLASQGNLEISVSDEGAGLPGGDIPNLFDILTQGDQSLARAQQGAGLGLPVANRIALAHGGELAVSPRGTEPARVSIVLPPSRLSAAPDRAAA